MPIYFDASVTDIRDYVRDKITHLGVSDDATAFDPTQSAIDPTGSGTNLIKAVSSTVNLDGERFEHEITIDGTSEFTGETINTISGLDGALRTDAYTRQVVSITTPVQSGVTYTIGVRVRVRDIT